MDVITVCPLRVGSIVWPSNSGAYALTVACKATYSLTMVESPLAGDQEPLQEADGHWNDDDQRSLHAAGDLAPFKAKADILLVGSAFAPRGNPVPSLVARMVVAGVDKSMAVFGDRVWLPDGRISEGAPFLKMPLRWERAAGGPGTANPAGVRADALPNLEPPGRYAARPGDLVEPMNFGPVAPTWPARSGLLYRHATTWDHARWYERPMPADIDPRYFNAAPPDQQVDEIRNDERIVLENLHPEHPRLVTSLVKVTPRAVIERVGAPPSELALRCDTITIDTDRGLCALVFRGQLWLQHPNEPGRVVVSLETPHAAMDNPVPSDVGMETVMMVSAPRAPALPFVPGQSPLEAAPQAPPPQRIDDPGATLMTTRWVPSKGLPFEEPPKREPPQVPQVPQVVSFGPPPAPPQEAPPATIPRLVTFGAPPPMPLIAPPAPVLPLDPGPAPPLMMSPPLDPPPAALRPAPPLMVLQPPDPPAPPLMVPPPPDPPSAAPPPAPPLIAPSSPMSDVSPTPAAIEAPTLPPPPLAAAEEQTADPADFPVDRFAALEATIAVGATSRAEVLRAAGLRERAFKAVERHFKDAFEAESATGSQALRGDYDAAYVATVEEARGPIELPEYARIMVGLERGRAPLALDALRIPRPALMPIVRRWTKKLAGDAKLAGESQAALRAARRG